MDQISSRTSSHSARSERESMLDELNELKDVVQKALGRIKALEVRIKSSRPTIIAKHTAPSQSEASNAIRNHPHVPASQWSNKEATMSAQGRDKVLQTESLQRPMIVSLPQETLLNIFDRLGFTENMNLSISCKQIHRAVADSQSLHSVRKAAYQITKLKADAEGSSSIALMCSILETPELATYPRVVDVSDRSFTLNVLPFCQKLITFDMNSDSYPNNFEKSDWVRLQNLLATIPALKFPDARSWVQSFQASNHDDVGYKWLPFCLLPRLTCLRITTSDADSLRSFINETVKGKNLDEESKHAQKLFNAPAGSKLISQGPSLMLGTLTSLDIRSYEVDHGRYELRDFLCYADLPSIEYIHIRKDLPKRVVPNNETEQWLLSHTTLQAPVVLHPFKGHLGTVSCYTDDTGYNVLESAQTEHEYNEAMKHDSVSVFALYNEMRNILLSRTWVSSTHFLDPSRFSQSLRLDTPWIDRFTVAGDFQKLHVCLRFERKSRLPFPGAAIDDCTVLIGYSQRDEDEEDPVLEVTMSFEIS